MKSKLLLVCVCVFFGSNVRHVSSQELMQNIFSFMELHPLDNTGTASDSNSAHLPPLDSLGTPINSLQPNTDTQKAKGLQADTSLSNKPPIKITDSSKPIGTGSPSDQVSSNTGNGADQFPAVAMDPSFQGDPFANDPFANDPFANDPFANDPFAMDQSTTGGDVPSIHQESPFFQFIPNTFKHDNTHSGSQVQSKPGLPIQTDPAINNDIPSDSFTSNVKQVDTGTSPTTGSGHPLDPLSPFDSGIPSEPIQLGAGTPLDSGLPIDPLPVDPFTPDHGMAGGDVPTITNDSPFFRFLPSMPTGDKFLNLIDGTENTFQPTDNWMGEPLGVAKLEPNALDPWDSFLPEEPMTDVNLDPVSAGTNVVDFQPDNQTPILPDSTPVDLNPLGPVKPIVSEKIADPHFKPTNPAGDHSVISLGPVDPNTIPLGPSDHNVFPIGFVDHNAIPLGPTDNNIMPNEPLGTKPLPHKETFKPVEPNVIPVGPVDKIPEMPKIDPNVIPLGPIFGTPVKLDSVLDNVNKGQGYDSRRRSGPSSPNADKAKPISNEIPNSWMQLYTKDRRRPSKSFPVQPEQTEAVQISPRDNLLAQASLNTYSKNRGLSRQLRQERRRARKLRQLQNQRQKQVQRQQKHRQKQINKARKQNQKMKNQRGGNRTGPQGAKIARMVIPGQNRPFVGKNQRGRGRRMVEPCNADRRRLGLCAHDQLPPDALDPIGHSNHNNEAGIMLGIPDHGLPPIGIDPSHGGPKPIVGPDTYVGRQPADGNVVQHNGNMHGDPVPGIDSYIGRQPAVGAPPLVDNIHGGTPVNMDSYEGRQQRGDSGHLIGGSHDQLPPDALDPIGHSNHNNEAGIMLGIPDHGIPQIGIDPTHGGPKPIVGPDTYVGRQPADGNAVQHNGNMHGDTFVGTGGYIGRQPAVGAAPLVDNTHGGRPVSMDSYEGRQQRGDPGHLIGGSHDQLPPDALDPIGHSNHNNEAGIMVGIPDHGLPPIGIDPTHGGPQPIVGPDTYVGRQPADGNVQHNGNMHGNPVPGIDSYIGRQPAVVAAPLVDNIHGRTPVNMDSYEGRQQRGDSGHLIGGSHGQLLPGTPTFEEHVGVPLGEAVIGHNGLQQLIGVQTVDPQNVGPLRKLGRGGRRQQGNRFNRNKGQRNKGGRIGRRNMRNNRNIGNVGNKRTNNFRKGNKRNQIQIHRPGARRRGPIIRTPNMQDVGIDSLPIDNPIGPQHAQESWNPMNGLHVGQPIDPTVHGIDVNDGAQHILDPLGSGIQISPHSFDPMTGLSGQSANVIQHDAAFHHEPASIHLDERMPVIQHDTAQHGMHVDNLPNGMSDTSLPNKQLGKQKGRNKQVGKGKGKNRQGGKQKGKNKQGGKQKGKDRQGGKQKVVSHLIDVTVPDINNSPLFDPQMTINAKNQGRNNRPKVNKKGRNKWKKVKGQNKKKDPKMREPRKFKPVEIQSVVTQERKPTTPDTAGMMRIAGLGFLDLSG